MRRTLIPAVGLICAALALTGCQSAQASEGESNAATSPITIAMPPVSDDPTKANPIDALVDLLAEYTGREVKITDVPDYMSVVEAIRSDNVDIGIMSGFPSALAVNTGEVDPLLAWKGDDSPLSTCVVLNDSPIKTIEDLRGKTVAFADKGSSSGYFMPVYMLDQAGLKQDKDYSAIFAGSHDGSFAALKQGQVDAACTAVILTEKAPPVFPFEPGEWRAVGESPAADITGAVLARKSLDETTRKQIEKAIPQVFSEKNADALGVLSIFVGLDVLDEPTPKDFANFADIAQVAGVTLKDLK